jgi:uncharacterized protein (DUF2267 family)
MKEILKELMKAYEKQETVKAYELLKDLKSSMMQGVSEEEAKEFAHELAKILHAYVSKSKTLSLLREAIENIL